MICKKNVNTLKQTNKALNAFARKYNGNTNKIHWLNASHPLFTSDELAYYSTNEPQIKFIWHPIVAKQPLSIILFIRFTGHANKKICSCCGNFITSRLIGFRKQNYKAYCHNCCIEHAGNDNIKIAYL